MAQAGKWSTRLCASYLAGTEVRASVLGCAALHAGQGLAARVAAAPISSLPLLLYPGTPSHPVWKGRYTGKQYPLGSHLASEITTPFVIQAWVVHSYCLCYAWQAWVLNDQHFTTLRGWQQITGRTEDVKIMGSSPDSVWILCAGGWACSAASCFSFLAWIFPR